MLDEEKAVQAVINTIDAKVEKYRQVIQSALIRNVPMKMRFDSKNEDFVYCPYCNTPYFRRYLNYWNYCGSCGQRLNSDEVDRCT